MFTLWKVSRKYDCDIHRIKTINDIDHIIIWVSTIARKNRCSIACFYIAANCASSRTYHQVTRSLQIGSSNRHAKDLKKPQRQPTRLLKHINRFSVISDIKCYLIKVYCIRLRLQYICKNISFFDVINYCRMKTYKQSCYLSLIP